MDFADYLQHDATALAALVKHGDVTASELLDLALARNAEVHGRINAVCRLLEPQARAQLARSLAGPLAGVPFLIKDGVQDYAGVPTSFGSRSMRGYVPTEHAAVVRRYLEAGLVIFGKTNLPEFALKAVTDPVLYGRASNPWNLGHTPGGSSGGAAAAVAAGIVPMAAGNDGGGSIRIPAACCGLFGLRASRGRVSSGPAIGEVWFGASSEGVLSRSVRDSALALDILAGHEPGDPFDIAPTAAPYRELVRRDPGKLRIGFSTVSPIGTEVHPEAVAAVQRAVQLLRGLGHEVEEAAPELDGAALAESFLHVYFGQVPAMLARGKALGAGAGDVELTARLLGTLGASIPAGRLTTQLAKWNEFSRALARFHARYDMLLTPTLAHPPIRHGEGDPPRGEQFVLDLLQRSGLLGILARLGLLEGTVNKIARDSLRYVPFTQLANLTGTPAMSVPLHWTAAGLPLGVQFVGRFGSEDKLLQLAHQLEQAAPWFERLAPLTTEGVKSTSTLVPA
ncbi:amidase [Massilia litorea]|uniref:Amidase n=1 Tax=Massilia litorea TaxID=2769491 RepID=A0A7L9U149_9BURK|nr:amidase [Massilia litorea]QOL47915.1 amidase [Massilia litorea]